MHHTILQCNKCLRAFIFDGDIVECCGKIRLAENLCPTYCKEDEHRDYKKVAEGRLTREYIIRVYDLIT